MSRFVKVPLRRNGRPGLIRYVASKASWVVASIVLASGLMAGSPARAGALIEIDSFDFTYDVVNPGPCELSDSGTSDPSMFCVVNEVTATAVYAEAVYLQLLVRVSFEGADGLSPNLADDYVLELSNLGADDFGYTFFGGGFGPAVYSYDVAPELLIGTITAEILSACAYVDSNGCSPVGFIPQDTGDSFRVVPEPSTLAIFGLGLAGLGFFMTRRRRVV